MAMLALELANEYLAQDPDIAKLREFTSSGLQEADPLFDVIAMDANAFKDEIALYQAITARMGLTPHSFPNRLDLRQPGNLEKQAAFVLAGHYVRSNPESSWPKIEELSRGYVEALLHFTNANNQTGQKLTCVAFTSHLFDGQELRSMDELTPYTFNCGLFVFGYKETKPGTGFTYALGFAASDED